MRALKAVFLTLGFDGRHHLSDGWWLPRQHGAVRLRRHRELNKVWLSRSPPRKSIRENHVHDVQI
jgi:hypothetical protein